MKWLGRDCEKREINTEHYGKLCTWFGGRREKLDSIEVTHQLNYLKKFQIFFKIIKNGQLLIPKFINFLGLATQLVRQISNTAIMMSTYEFELIVYALSINLNATFYLKSTSAANVSKN
jgi:hypothetical protein